MCVGNVEYLYIVMAATIVIHATIPAFLSGVMPDRNIRQIAHTIMSAHHHACRHRQV